jgi:hypothetical protein
MIIHKQGTRIVAERKEKEIPMAQVNPNVTIGGICDDINDPNPIVVVTAHRNTAFPVKPKVLSTLATGSTMAYSSAYRLA